MFLGKNWKFRLSLSFDKMGLEKMSDDHLVKKKQNKPSYTKILKLCFFFGWPIQVFISHSVKIGTSVLVINYSSTISLLENSEKKPRKTQ